MKPRLFTLLAALSALACVALMVLWVRSARTSEALIEPRRPGERWLVTSTFGVLTFEHQAPQAGATKAGWVYFHGPLPRNWVGRWQWLGFDAYRARVWHYVLLPPARAYGLSVPHWALIAPAGVLPLAWLRRTRRRIGRRRRERRGLCPRCGYDLRASPTRCPECGRAIGLTAFGGAHAAPAGGLV